MSSVCRAQHIERNLPKLPETSPSSKTCTWWPDERRPKRFPKLILSEAVSYRRRDLVVGDAVNGQVVLAPVVVLRDTASGVIVLAATRLGCSGIAIAPNSRGRPAAGIPRAATCCQTGCR